MLPATAKMRLIVMKTSLIDATVLFKLIAEDQDLPLVFVIEIVVEGLR